MPSLLMSLREARFISKDGDFGTLEISRKKGSIWIIDGQHRVGGFEKVREHFIFARNPNVDSKLFTELMNYELPVVFIDTRKAAERISSNTLGQTTAPEDIERATFFIVNKTQKGINPSLKDALLYRIKIGGIEGIPTLKKESWRVHAAHIGISMRQENDSSLKDRINISGRKGAGRPIQLNSFISSLRPLFVEKEFLKLNDFERLNFLKNFWNALKEILPEAFDTKTWKQYMVMKAIGVYCLNWLACDIFKMCTEHGRRYDDEKALEKLVEPLKSFDWGSQTSPLSSFAGMKGVRKGYELLCNVLYTKEKGEATKSQSLEGYVSS
jgi:DGQHR domain-containing protein